MVEIADWECSGRGPPAVRTQQLSGADRCTKVGSFHFVMQPSPKRAHSDCIDTRSACRATFLCICIHFAAACRQAIEVDVDAAAAQTQTHYLHLNPCTCSCTHKIQTCDFFHAATTSASTSIGSVNMASIWTMPPMRFALPTGLSPTVMTKPCGWDETREWDETHRWTWLGWSWG